MWQQVLKSYGGRPIPLANREQWEREVKRLTDRLYRQIFNRMSKTEKWYWWGTDAKHGKVGSPGHLYHFLKRLMSDNRTEEFNRRWRRYEEGSEWDQRSIQEGVETIAKKLGWLTFPNEVLRIDTTPWKFYDENYIKWKQKDDKYKRRANSQVD